MDNVDEMYYELDNLLTEQSRIEDYRKAYAAEITPAERLDLDMQNDSIAFELEKLHKRLERVLAITEVLEDLETQKPL